MKSQKKLERFKLTEEEKEALKRSIRVEATIDAILLVLALGAGLTVLMFALWLMG